MFEGLPYLAGMPVMTVQGLKDSAELGVTTPHEHILIDLRNQFTYHPEATRTAYAGQKVNIRNLDVLSRDPYAVLDNLLLNDVPLAESELLEFKKAGGDSVVDATSIGIGRDPEALYRISRATGLNVIAGCGYYTCDTHPPDMDARSVEQVAGEIVRDITVGMQGTGIRAGVIGEIGTSVEICANEKKVLQAAAAAHRKTGAGVIVHTYPWGKRGLEALELLVSGGVDAHKVSINHVDVELDLDYCAKIAEAGAFFEFDDFGKEFFIDRRYRGFAGGVFARDIERVRALKKLIEGGFLSNILMSCDVCLKTLLHRYGGWGYDHILTHVVPMMLDEGVTRQQLDVILKENPRVFLDMKPEVIHG
jgi:phosphotriesterase-related protein